MKTGGSDGIKLKAFLAYPDLDKNGLSVCSEDVPQ